MAEFSFTLDTRPALAGTEIAIGGNRIVARTDLALVSVATPLGGDAALTRALQDGLGLALPAPTLSTIAGEMRAIRTAPDQLLLAFPHPTPDARGVINAKLGNTGYTTDQTDAWVILEVSGPDTLAALERLCPLDVNTFEVGGSGRTMMEHMGALIVRTGPQAFWLMSASSSAGSFLHAVETSFRNVVTV